jgi:hypothetical protein
MRSEKSASAWVEMRITAGPAAAIALAQVPRQLQAALLRERDVNQDEIRRSCWVSLSAAAVVRARPTTDKPCRSRRTLAASRNDRLSSTIRTRNTMRPGLQGTRRTALQLAGTSNFG